MPFADHLRRSAPSEAEIRERKLLEENQQLLAKKQLEEQLQAAYREEFQLILSEILNRCEQANSQGENYLYEEKIDLADALCHKTMFLGRTEEENSKHYALMVRELQSSLKAEGFKRVKVYFRDNKVYCFGKNYCQLYVSLSWK